MENSFYQSISYFLTKFSPTRFLSHPFRISLKGTSTLVQDLLLHCLLAVYGILKAQARINNNHRFRYKAIKMSRFIFIFSSFSCIFLNYLKLIIVLSYYIFVYSFFNRYKKYSHVNTFSDFDITLMKGGCAFVCLFVRINDDVLRVGVGRVDGDRGAMLIRFFTALFFVSPSD